MNRLPDMARLQSGGILKDMRKNINDRVNQKDSKRQLFLYSGVSSNSQPKTTK